MLARTHLLVGATSQDVEEVFDSKGEEKVIYSLSHNIDYMLLLTSGLINSAVPSWLY